MLLMSSRMTTVLPTPAPPNAPALPPLMNGQIRSMTLMPVSRIWALVSWSTSAGAGRWIGYFLSNLTGPRVVHRRAGDVEDAAEDAGADRHGDRGAGVDDVHAALQALGRGHRDGAGEAAAEVLLDLERQHLLLAGDRELDGERLVDGRDGVLGELDVDDGADDLDDFAGVHVGKRSGVCVKGWIRRR